MIQNNMGILKQTWAFLAVLSWESASVAGNCLPPIVPLMPTDADDVRAYADLLRRDAETYFFDVKQYSRCQDQVGPASLAGMEVVRWEVLQAGFLDVLESLADCPNRKKWPMHRVCEQVSGFTASGIEFALGLDDVRQFPSVRS